MERSTDPDEKAPPLEGTPRNDPTLEPEVPPALQPVEPPEQG